ncbi:T9SS type A sorting domain-containing protein [Hyunsoonleella ulvae]|uniref:T9SS type A sorting domain-containing protein n=1 Tax=Hyunsoonleella ulvae TaxID=2799948 RepID=UPI00193956E4|nr:M64 family metallopeptidase [Hyunsoonleella ulvae]
MKKLFFYLILALSTTIKAQVFDIETIKISGDDNKRINLVILSEGYQASELSDFITDATTLTNEMFSESPFSEYADFFNVYAIKVPSNESGADHPTDGIFVDTYFNATYDSFGSPRLLYYEIDGNNANNTEAKILSLLADSFPNYDQALILVNSPEYGGSGGEFPMAYNGTWSTEVMMHEIGHSLFDLKDEYYPGDILAGEAINMTRETNPTHVRWKNWLNINSVGIYQYDCTTGNCTDWYKPHDNSIMEFIDKPFGAVCKEGMVLKIHDLVSTVDDFTPNNSSSIENPTFPLDFELTLIKPTPNTLESVWTLNGNTMANNVDMLSLLETDVIDGSNTLTAVITDKSPMLRVDSNVSIHISTVTWTVNYSALSIEDIDATANNYTISIYPNPANSVLNFKVESNIDTTLKVVITSLDGKQLESLTLTNYEPHDVDISDLSSGIYIAHFYSNNALLTSRKIIRN